MIRALIACLLLALALAGAAMSSYSSPKLNEVASWLAQRPVRVTCLTRPEEEADFVILQGAEAYVSGWSDSKGRWHPSGTTVVRGRWCRVLLGLERGRLSEFSVSDVSFALLVLTHESAHLRGHRWSGSEAKAQCWAIRHVGYVASRFGITDPVMNRLIVAFALSAHEELPLEYRDPKCVLPVVS